jgi:hypothetical protein
MAEFFAHIGCPSLARTKGLYFCCSINVDAS